MSLLRIASLCALVVAVAACSSGDRRPQKEHTFTGNLTDAQRAQAGHNKRVRDRMEAEESAALYKRLDVKIAKLDSNAPYAGLGFLPNNSVGYVVQRDSQAALFTYKGTLTKLDRLVKRVDHAELAGPGSNRILGLSAHGSQAAWNAGNLTQQIILRPQKTTFDRVKMFDSQPVSQGSYLVTASEGGLLETWSLASGNRMRAVRFSNFQPRQIGRNISVNRVIFGTNDGQVRIWHGGSGSDFQYQHSGPLLELLCIPKHNLIGSVGKDGQVILYDMTKRQVVFSQQFPKADYQLVLSDDEEHLIAAPAVGFPMAINLATLKSSKVRHTPTNLTTKVEFGVTSDFALSQHGANGVMLWNLSREVPITYKLIPKTIGKPIDFTIAKKTNIAAVLTDRDYIEYWDIGAKKYLGPALRSIGSNIAGVEISDDASWLLVALADGRLVRQRVIFGEAKPVEIE